MAFKVGVKGLAQFTRALGAVDKGLKKEVRLVLNEAADLVVSGAKPTVPTGKRGRAKKSVRAQSTQKFARVSGGGSQAPYYPWLDFGGSVGRNGSITRPYTRKGRYIYPTYRGLRDSGEFQQTMLDGLNELGRRHGLDIEVS